MSLDNLDHIFSNYRSLDLKKELQAYSVNSRIFKDSKKTHYNRIEKEASVIVDYFATLIQAEREAEQVFNLKTFIEFEEISLKELTKQNDTLTFFNEKDNQRANECVFQTIQPSVFFKFLGKVTAYVEKMRSTSVAGLLFVVKCVLAHNPKYYDVDQEQIQAFCKQIDLYIRGKVLPNNLIIGSPLLMSIILNFSSIFQNLKNGNEHHMLIPEIGNELFHSIEDKINNNFKPFSNYSNEELRICIKLLSGSPIIQQNQSENKKIEKVIMEELVQRRLDYFSQEDLIDLLLNLKLSKMTISREVAQKIIKNSCNYDITFSPLYMYLLITTFSNSKLPMSELDNQLFHNFKIMLSPNQIEKYNFQELKMITRILEYFSQNRLNAPKMNSLKVRIQFLLSTIKGSVIKNQNCPIIDVLILATIFAKHISIPNFLFDIIIERHQDIQVDQEQRYYIQNFIDILCSRFQKTYSYNTFLEKTVDFNNNSTRQALDMLSIFFKKFVGSNYISYNLMACEIAQNQDLFKNMIPNASDRRNYISDLANKIVSFSKLSETNQIDNFYPIIAVINNNIKIVSKDKNIYSVLKIVTEKILEVQGNSKNINNLISPVFQIYESSRYLSTHENSQRQQFFKIQNQLNTFLTNVIIPNLVQIVSLGKIEITHNESVQQFFNGNILSSELKHLDYLPQLLKISDIKLSESIKKKICILIDKVFITWKDDCLLYNVINLNQMGMLSSKQAYEGAQNIFTFVEYEPERNKLKLQENSDHEAILTFIEICCNKIRDHFQIIDKNAINAQNFMPLSALGALLMDKITDSQLFNLLEILGNKRSNYCQPFLEELKKRKIDAFGKTNPQIIESYSKFPYFIDNQQLMSLFSGIQDLNNQSEYLIDLAINRRIFSPKIDRSISNEMLRNDEIPLAKLLDYFEISIVKDLQDEHYTRFFNLFLKQKDSIKTQKSIENLFLFVSSIPQEYKRNNSILWTKIKNELVEISKQLIYHPSYGNSVLKIAGIGGTIQTLKYYKSLSIKGYNMHSTVQKSSFLTKPIIENNALEQSSNSFKIENNFPFSQEFTLKDSFLSNFGQSTQKAKETVGKEKQIVLDLKSSLQEHIDKQTIILDYFLVLKRYLVYHEISNTLDLNLLENEVQESTRCLIFSLKGNFREMEIQFGQQKKSGDDYIDFLIDLTSIIQNNGFSYETGFTDPNTSIIMDIYLEELKFAIFFLSEDEVKNDFTSGQASPLQIIQHKANFLFQKSGISSLFIEPISWKRKYPNAESQNDFIIQSLGLSNKRKRQDLKQITNYQQNFNQLFQQVKLEIEIFSIEIFKFLPIYIIGFFKLVIPNYLVQNIPVDFIVDPNCFTNICNNQMKVLPFYPTFFMGIVVIKNLFRYIKIIFIKVLKTLGHIKICFIRF